MALEVDLQAPAVLLFSFVPMFLIAAAFFYMNRADPDCGTAFSWITRALGPCGASPRTGEELRAHNEALEELGREATDEGLANARQAGVDAEVALVADRPAAALLSLAEEHDARFIVVGSYGESPMRSAILGSTPSQAAPPLRARWWSSPPE